jgi:hypothetical protein
MVSYDPRLGMNSTNKYNRMKPIEIQCCSECDDDFSGAGVEGVDWASWVLFLCFLAIGVVIA